MPVTEVEVEFRSLKIFNDSEGDYSEDKKTGGIDSDKGTWELTAYINDVSVKTNKTLFDSDLLTVSDRAGQNKISLGWRIKVPLAGKQELKVQLGGVDVDWGVDDDVGKAGVTIPLPMTKNHESTQSGWHNGTKFFDAHILVKITEEEDAPGPSYGDTYTPEGPVSKVEEPEPTTAGSPAEPTPAPSQTQTGAAVAVGHRLNTIIVKRFNVPEWQAKMDRVLSGYTMTIMLDGAPVTVRTPFRMLHPGREKSVDDRISALAAGWPDFPLPAGIRDVLSGKGSVKEIEDFTSWLLSAKKDLIFRPEDVGNDADQNGKIISNQLGTEGAGLDCSGSSWQMIYQCSNETSPTGAPAGMGLDFHDSKYRSAARRIPLTEVRTADAIIFQNKSGGGHKVVVHTHEVHKLREAMTIQKHDWATKNDRDVAFADVGDRIHRYVVASSWGSSGPKKNPFYFNETRGVWFNSGASKPDLTDTPYNYPIAGAFRANSLPAAPK